jgi:hypothetical protein
MEKKQSEIEAKLNAEIEKNHPTRPNLMSGHFDYNAVFKLMQQAYNLDRESLPVTGTAEEMYMEGRQPFELFPDLAEDLQYAACNWKVDMSTWNSLLDQINKVSLLASTQSTTIERLTKALHLILGTPSKSDCDIIAREALNSIKK